MAFYREDKGIVSQRIDKLLQSIESEQESLKWKIRANAGASRKRYEEVGEVERAPHLVYLDDKNNSR